MDKRVILAVAGAGKTYHICHSIDPQRRNLILAFTHENIHNIRRELCNAFGAVPEYTIVKTFDSFLYQDLILPYEPSVAEFFHLSNFYSRGISMSDPPPRQIRTRTGRTIANPKYKSADKIEHYVTQGGQYYCSTLSELVLQIKKGKDSLVKRSATRLNLFYDQILIDEFQDFREHDFDVIVSLSKCLTNILLVGDFYQHSVSGVNNSGKPFKKGKSDISYAEFILMLEALGFKVDQSSLIKTKRCAPDICTFVREKLGIQIYPDNEHHGTVSWVKDDVHEILKNDSIIKLVYNKASQYPFAAMNWSYSKGNTVDNACVILSANLDNIDADTFSLDKISISTVNKLYVALTRTKGNLYLVKHSVYEQAKKEMK